MNNTKEFPNASSRAGDVMASDHEASCICQECSDRISEDAGVEFIWKCDEGYTTKYYFHISPVTDKLRAEGFYEMGSRTPNVAQYRNMQSCRIVTVKRIEVADRKQQ
jgi:hypothetical protein